MPRIPPEAATRLPGCGALLATAAGIIALAALVLAVFPVCR
jgi:hypothetical protein